MNDLEIDRLTKVTWFLDKKFTVNVDYEISFNDDKSTLKVNSNDNKYSVNNINDNKLNNQVVNKVTIYHI